MKIQIRKRVWETNSSSTHSLQIIQKTVEEYVECLGKKVKINVEYISPDRFIKNKTFYLTGLSIKDGMQLRDFCYIIESWICKIQYIFMTIISKVKYYDFKDYYDVQYPGNQPLIYTDYNDGSTYMTVKQYRDKIFNSSPYLKFISLVKDYVNSKVNEEVENVVFAGNHSQYIDLIAEDSLGKQFSDIRNRKEIFSDEFIEELFNKVMKEDYLIVHEDEVYMSFGSDGESIHVFRDL